MAIRQPERASSIAMPRPMPRDAPVMRTEFDGMPLSTTMRNARIHLKYPANRSAGQGSVAAQPKNCPMKNTLIFTILAAGLVLAGCNKSTRTSTAANDPAITPTTTPSATSTTTSTDTFGSKVDRATDRVADASRDAADKVRDASHDAANTMRNAGHDLSARMSEWRLSSSEIESDLTANRPIVRSNANAPTGKIDKGNLEKAIKGKLRSDPQLADLSFDVNANSKGEVTLEGKARDAGQVAQAIATALDTEGTAQVTSKIKLDPK